MVACPICGKPVKPKDINNHIDSNCESYIETFLPPPQTASSSQASKPTVSSFFQTPAAKRASSIFAPKLESSPIADRSANTPASANSKRPLENGNSSPTLRMELDDESEEPPAKKSKRNAIQEAAPLAERMRPRTLDEVCGQELVGPNGVLRGLIESDRVPSMVLWGGAGTGKTTIARCIAHRVNSRFIEINSTSSGVSECKKLFAEAKNELSLTGRKTIIFCDEIHRFSKSQQDVFLGPVESGIITLIGATTENPSFKVQNALLSRCRVFTLSKLTTEDIESILQRALTFIYPSDVSPSALIDSSLLNYLSAFSDGDARTALNLLDLAICLTNNPNMTLSTLKSSLTKSLVYDRAGDQHYDTISAFHKSVRGSDADASLYYLARMLQSGEDPLYIARRMVVIASEDIGIADNSMLPLATAAYTAAEKIGMPECRINLAHCCVALCRAPKSTKVYRSLNNVFSALKEPGTAGLPVPIHLRNAPTKLLKSLDYGAEYKYNPNYKDGRVVQEYLPEGLRDRKFMEEKDLGTVIDPGAWADGELPSP